MKIIMQIIGALDVEQTWKISFSNYCAKGVSWAKNCKFLWKIVSKNLATKKLLIKSFQKLFLGVLNVEQIYENALFSIKAKSWQPTS